MQRDEILSMEAGRELDALVAERVMGWGDISLHPMMDSDWWGMPSGPATAIQGAVGWLYTHEKVPNYSTDIAAAWEVVEAVRGRGWSLSLGEGMSGYGDAVVWMVDFYKGNRICLSANGPDVPLAICRAALLAVMEDDDARTD